MNRISVRDNLLITAGSRAGFMNAAGFIDIPPGIDAEDELAEYILDIVHEYASADQPESFDEFIERKILIKYGDGKESECQ